VSPIVINHPIVLLVEGQDEEIFFKAYLSFLKGINDEWARIDDIQIICYGGITKLGSFLKTLPDISGAEIIRKIGIIRDAEDDAVTAFNEIKRLLREAGFDSPQTQLSPTSGRPIINVMIIPEQGNGSIEISFLESVNDDPAIPCVNQYMTCLTGLYERAVLQKPKNPFKSRLHAFLSSRKEPSISIGGATQKKYWNYNSTAFNRIKDFLKQLVNQYQ
jgi:hypothetical protein